MMLPWLCDLNELWKKLKMTVLKFSILTVVRFYDSFAIPFLPLYDFYQCLAIRSSHGWKRA